MPKKTLSTLQEKIARKNATEAPFSGPWIDEKREGIYTCIVCDHQLFLSQHKYDSGSGWPSFWQVANKNSLGSTIDSKLSMVRNEVHCAKCKSHMGHVFSDGPKPTGLRYCINGSVLDFTPKGEVFI